MLPEYFPWLFDDKIAWEQSLTDPRYSYELPIDCFMVLYSARRSPEHSNFSHPTLAVSMPIAKSAVPLTHVPTANPAEVFAYAAAAPAAAVATAAPAKPAKKEEEGILSQEEIDALLAGI